MDVDDAVILKHCPTRWLSLERVINRALNQLPALTSYFASNDDGLGASGASMSASAIH